MLLALALLVFLFFFFFFRWFCMLFILESCIWLQPFWPSLVMKKWLNIKPKVYDFSEDEYTETESEDDGMVLVFTCHHSLLITLTTTCLIMFCQFLYSVPF